MHIEGYLMSTYCPIPPRRLNWYSLYTVVGSQCFVHIAHTVGSRDFRIERWYIIAHIIKQVVAIYSL